MAKEIRATLDQLGALLMLPSLNQANGGVHGLKTAPLAQWLEESVGILVAIDSID